MRKNYALTFNGISLSDYYCFYDGSQSFKIPQKMVDTYSVVGKNGDLSIDQKKYSNITIPFNCFITRDFIQNYMSLMNSLMSQEGYGRLETTEEPDVYRMALFNSETTPTTWALNESGTFTLEFDCKPQKWLKSGETAITVTGTQTLVNPCQMASKPLIEVVGTGSVTIGTSVLALSTNTSTTYIDCEIQDAYEGTINRNPALTVTNGFPELASGSNTVTVTGFTSCKITPRWWRL